MDEGLHTKDVSRGTPRSEVQESIAASTGATHGAVLNRPGTRQTKRGTCQVSSGRGRR